MKTIKFILFTVAVTALLVLVSSFKAVEKQTSEEKELFDTIVSLDSTFFSAYNTCDLKTAADLISEDLEFYHDQGGLSTSKEDIMSGLKNNICGKVRRELVKGSVEVSPIPNFGAVQIGMHKFYNNQEPNAESKPNRFVTLWKKTNNSWQITRVISLHSS